MPQIGPLEIAVVLLVALLVFGPSKLPEVGKQAARGLREFRQFQANVRDDLKGMLDPDDERTDTVAADDDDFVPPDPPEDPPALEAGPAATRTRRPTTPDARVRRLRPTPRRSRPRGQVQAKVQGGRGCRRPHDGRRAPHRAAPTPHHLGSRGRRSGRSSASSSPSRSSASSSEYYTDATDGEKQTLIFLGPLDAFATRLKIATYGGIVLALPVWLYQLWRFITPGLNPKERSYAIPFVLTSIVLFALGALRRAAHAAPGARLPPQHRRLRPHARS